MVRNDAKADACRSQSIDVGSHEGIFFALVRKLLVRLRMQMKICSQPCAAICKRTGFVRCIASCRYTRRSSISALQNLAAAVQLVVPKGRETPLVDGCRESEVSCAWFSGKTADLGGLGGLEAPLTW